jgi:hypothetical protein
MDWGWCAISESTIICYMGHVARLGTWKIHNKIFSWLTVCSDLVLLDHENEAKFSGY